MSGKTNKGDGMSNIYEELNRVIEEIENHLLEPLDKKKIASLIGLSWTNLNLIFTALSGISLNEYVKYRRLSLSVNDILNGKSITEVSYKYLYNSPSSYNRAFKSFHGFSPREVKKQNKELNLFKKIVFKKQSENPSIEYKIYKAKKFELYGISKKVNYKTRHQEITEFWEEIKKSHPKFLKEKRYGFLERNEKEGSFYYCCLDKKFEGSVFLTLPASNYFCIKTTNFESVDIIEKLKISEQEYIKSLNYNCRKHPKIEIYHENYIELLIPIT